jgi:hypothetical protein
VAVISLKANLDPSELVVECYTYFGLHYVWGGSTSVSRSITSFGPTSYCYLFLGHQDPSVDLSCTDSVEHYES